MKLLSIYSTDNSTAMFKFEQDGDIFRPLEYWQSSAADRKVLSMCKTLSADFEQGDYIVLNGLVREKEDTAWTNPLSERLSEYGVKHWYFVLQPSQLVVLMASFELVQAKQQLDTSSFEEWPKLQRMMESVDELPARSLAFLQGLSELKNPCKKSSFWGVEIYKPRGNDIVSQIQIFAGS